MASLVEALSKELECSICIDRLHNAKSLNCLHAFCEKCLESCVQRGPGPDSRITCPVCREVTRLPRDGVGGLKTNALVNSLIEKLEAWRVDGGHDQSSTRNILGQKSTVQCEHHPGKPIKFCCSDCNKLGCQLCTKIPYNVRQHRYISVQNKAKSVRAETQTVVDKWHAKHTAAQNVRVFARNRKDEAKEAVNKLRADVKEKTEKIINEVKNQEEKLLHRLDKVEGKVNESLDEVQAKCNSIEDGLQTVKKKWTDVLRKGDDIEIITSHGSVVHDMEELYAIDVSDRESQRQFGVVGELQFEPGRLYMEMTRGSRIGQMRVRRQWDIQASMKSASVSKLAFKSNGSLVIGHYSGGIEISGPDQQEYVDLSFIMPVRNLTVLENDDIVFLNQRKAVFLIVDGQEEPSRHLGEFSGKWVSLDTYTVDDESYIVVVDQHMEQQEIVCLDKHGNRAATMIMSRYHGVRHFCVDRNRRGVFISYQQDSVHACSLQTGAPEIYSIAQEGRRYVALACHQSTYLYVASVRVDDSRLLSIDKHSLDDGRLVECVLRDFQIQNGRRVVMANRRDEEIVLASGDDIYSIMAEENYQVERTFNLM